MCDYSLKSVRSRPAKVGDKLVTRDFGTGTSGFAASDDLGLAVCVLPGAELAFAREVRRLPVGRREWWTADSPLPDGNLSTSPQGQMDSTPRTRSNFRMGAPCC